MSLSASNDSNQRYDFHAHTAHPQEHPVTDEEVFDITIVGAGPTGLFAAFYAGLRDMKTKVIEALPEPGGQLAVLYPEKMIYDVPGHPKI
jgi:alkyl hydroperoxide reductase subunit AhpF